VAGVRLQVTFDKAGVDRALQARAQRMVEQLDEVVADVARIVADNWRAKVPVGPEPTRPPGRPHYRDAINVGRLPTMSWRPFLVAYLVSSGIPGRLPWRLEFGTSKMPAHPSARPALDESRAEMIETVRSGLSE
jgi:hypothetical protein